MTKERKRISLKTVIASLGSGSFSVELRKSAVGAVMLVSGVLGVGELTEERITLLSHGGRLYIAGDKLSLSALENRTLEIYGRITGLEFSYGKR